jgi:phthiodiolone/phenolphthiodiolone dimycocerosates ketoreductase
MTMSHLTKTAPILGIGAGEAENTEPYGLTRTRPAARLDEALQIVRRCFTSRGPVDFAGEFFTLDGAVLDLEPAPGRVPQIWVAAHGPRMLELTGRHGDGWYPTLPYTPQGYADALAVVRGHARNSGRDAAAIVPAWSGLVVLGRTEAEARRLLDRRLIRFIALLAPAELWRRHGAAHPLGEDFGGLVEFIPQRFTRPELEAAMSAVPIDLAAETLLWGTPATVEHAVGELVDAGLRHVVLHAASASASPRHAAYSLWHTSRILRRLRSRSVS